MPNSLEAYVRSTLSLSSSNSNLQSLALNPQNDRKKEIDLENIDDSTANSFILSATPTWIQGILKQKEMVKWCIYWFISNVIITFYNKHILSSMNISPTTNTFIHMFYTFIGCLIVEKGKFPKLTKNEFFRILVYSFIFALNISWFQFSVKLTTLSLNQASRTMTPLFQALFSYLIVGRHFSTYTMIPLFCLFIGPTVTFDAEINLTLLGLIVSISSIIISALKGALSMKILQDLKHKLQQYSLLVVVTPLASIWMILFKIFVFFYEKSYSNNNYNNIDTFDIFKNYNLELIIYLSIGGFMAFAINTASIGTVKRTSATSLGVMAQGKQALIIMSSMFIAERDWTWNKLIGVTITLTVAAWYAYRKEKERMNKMRQNAQKIPN